ncbi:MAG: carboxypeptidase regulatory-like domain-containing protein [Nitrospirota bacterium]
MKKFFYLLTVVSILMISTGLVLAGDVVAKVKANGTVKIKEGKKKEDDIRAKNSVVIGADGAVANAVITIKGAKGVKAGSVTVDQKDRVFVPHAMTIAPGTTVNFTTQDELDHTTYATDETNAVANIKDPIKLHMPGDKGTHKFEKPGIVDLRCKDHKRMQLWVIVTDEYAGVTDKNGVATIKGVPAGKYTAEVWHEVLGTKTAEVTVGASGNVEVSFTLDGNKEI